VNDEETEKSALCSKVGAISKTGAKRNKEINKDFNVENVNVRGYK
jgi:hypothetical protein